MSAGPKPLNGLRRHPGLALTPRYPASTPPPVLSRVEVRWSVARRALGVHAPEGGSRMIDLTIGLTIGPAIRPATGSSPLLAHAVIAAADPASGSVRVLRSMEDVAVEVIDDIRSEIHIEAPGVLHATVSPNISDPSGPWRLVYARTPVLAELAVPGGRAEPAGVRVEA